MTTKYIFSAIIFFNWNDIYIYIYRKCLFNTSLARRSRITLYPCGRVEKPRCLVKNHFYFHFIIDICYKSRVLLYKKKIFSFNLEHTYKEGKSDSSRRGKGLYYHFPDTVMQSDRNCYLVAEIKIEAEVCT